MLTFSDGNIFESGCDLLVCPTNCMPGVMGKGLALEFAKRYPGLTLSHREAYSQGWAKIGKVSIEPTEEGQLVAFFATKDHWRMPSLMHYVDHGLDSLGSESHHWNKHDPRKIRTIAIPALGCGLGGLPWPAVRDVIVRWSETADFDVVVFPPKDGR